jgi:gluconokinase
MIILLMGTTGAGKTTIGQLLSARLQWIFLDADDFHPAANIEKMHRGIPLDDADRAPWLAKIHSELASLSAQAANVVLACSALKQIYRDQISAGLDVHVVYLHGSYQLMAQHIAHRHGHFAGEAILAGQFADLEEPHNALVVEVSNSPEKIVDEIIRQLNLPAPTPTPPAASAPPQK